MSTLIVDCWDEIQDYEKSIIIAVLHQARVEYEIKEG